jgi:hypothetical protein
MGGKRVFFKLDFSKVDPKFPMPPQVSIRAKHDATNHLLTPKIIESESDGYIDYLIKELEQTRQEGKRKFAAAKNKLNG